MPLHASEARRLESVTSTTHSHAPGSGLGSRIKNVDSKNRKARQESILNYPQRVKVYFSGISNGRRTLPVLGGRHLHDSLKNEVECGFRIEAGFVGNGQNRQGLMIGFIQ